MKKRLIAGSIIIAIIGLTMAMIPLLFKNKIKETLLHAANTHLDARLEIYDLSLNLLSDFPGITFYLKELRLIKADSLENDTILQVEAAQASLTLWELMNGKYDISQVRLDHVKISAKRLPDGSANWQVIRKDTLTKENASLKVKLRKASLNHCNIIYKDEVSNIQLEAIDWNGWLLGDFTSGKSVFRTQSAIEEVSFSINKVPYLKKIRVATNTSIEADLTKKKLTFKKSSLKLNHVKLGMDGSVALPGNNKIDYDLKFLGADITFKDILSLKPALYAGIYQEIESSGSVAFQGYIQGVREQKRYPSFKFHLAIDKAMFQYASPDLSMKDIEVDATLSSANGLMDSTVLDIKKLRFTTNDKPFQARLEVRSPVGNLQINGHTEGTLDLGLLNKLHLWDQSVALDGIVTTELDIATQMPDTSQLHPRTIETNGYVKLNKVSVKSGKYIDLGVEKAQVNFKSHTTTLSLHNLRSKESKLSANGSIENLAGYALKGEDMKARITVQSTYINPKDFAMSGKGSSVFVVPSNIDLTVNASVQRALYSSLELVNATGEFSMKNQIFGIKSFSAATLDGNCTISGSYNTVNRLQPKLTIALNLNKVSFASTVKSLEVAQLYTPVFKSVTGHYSLNFNFSMIAKRRTEETLAGITGSGWLRTDEVKVTGVGSLTKLSSLLNIHLFNSFTTKNVYVPFAVRDSRITTQPFDVNINHVKMNVGGTTGFDQSIDYKGTLFFPPYMLIGLVSNVGFKIKGDFSNPQVSLVPAPAIKSTSNKIVSGAKKTAEFGVNQTKKLLKKK